MPGLNTQCLDERTLRAQRGVGAASELTSGGIIAAAEQNVHPEITPLKLLM